MDRYPGNLPIIEHINGRADVLSGPERRRRWTFEQKARIVAESMAPHAVTSEVARRHGVHPNQLYGWRRELRDHRSAPVPATEFVPVAITVDPFDADPVKRQPGAMGGIELRIGDAEMWIGPDVEPQAVAAAISAAIRALKAKS